MPDPTPAAPSASPTQPTPQDVESGKAMAVLCYVPIGPINLIVSIVCLVTKSNAYSLYHAKQSITLLICMMIAAVICLPLMCIGIGIIGYPIVILMFFIFSIVGIANALSGKAKPLPITGKFAEKWFGSIQKA